MYTRCHLSWKWILFVLPMIWGLTGCRSDTGAPPAKESGTALPLEDLAVAEPETARDVALAYIRTYHPGTGPSQDAFWFEETAVPEGQAESSTYRYRYEAWVVTVSFPVVDPAETRYTVTVESSSPTFDWEGRVDAAGAVVERSFILADLVPTVAPPTATPIPSSTATSTGTATASATPTETAPPVETTPSEPSQTATANPTNTAVSGPCNAAEFIKDVTIQDGTYLSPGADFTKIWRLKNVGNCAWSTNYDLVFVDGSQMGGDPVRALPGNVKPGETVDIAIALEAPEDPGDYRGLWKLRDADGVPFGLGRAANQSFWVSIIVVEFREGDYVFDFALNYCLAKWWSENGRIPCPGFVNTTDGFVQLLSGAELENRPEDEPILWVHPNEARNGWIEGTFPIHEVEKGDRFRAWVGCMKSYHRCNLTFYLDYETRNGRVYRLDQWAESYDGEITEIDIDLSDLEGERIRLILGVEANTKIVQDAQGFWFVPRIE